MTAVIVAALFVLVKVGAQRMVLAPIDEAMKACEAIAAGDLTRDLPTSAPGEIGQLLIALRGMRDRLAQTVMAIGKSSQECAQGRRKWPRAAQIYRLARNSKRPHCRKRQRAWKS